jgi:hypothetical protein
MNPPPQLLRQNRLMNLAFGSGFAALLMIYVAGIAWMSIRAGQ